MNLKEYQKKYRQTHKKQAKKYRIKHKRKQKILGHIWYLKNKKLTIKRVSTYRKNKRKAYLKWLKKYQKTHKKEIQKYHKRWFRLNKEKINEYYKNKRKTNLGFKILCNLRIRLWRVLKGKNKSKTTLQLLGCSVKFLKHYLQKRFKPGMTWSNYGKWEIDHIRPCYDFDLLEIDEQKRCFHYTNLQPCGCKKTA